MRVRITSKGWHTVTVAIPLNEPAAMLSKVVGFFSISSAIMVYYRANNVFLGVVSDV
jgi:hypothetical protein